MATASGAELMTGSMDLIKDRVRNSGMSEHAVVQHAKPNSHIVNNEKTCEDVELNSK
ncbi:hypothetical protein RvY_03038 [Ramazzottius varieornatus]|uniref:Uncharacterized protein n=1 Tax=Ramazzottius varieornatus TaxID=947166 RepID=A0A1D1ULP0_RAMVA|nr:hypothetical protein RvY_03038 [Ramazzottius varieornatus]